MRVSTDSGQDQLSDAVKPQLKAVFALTAVWLLGPSSRDERILRRLRLAWADSRDLEKAVLRAGKFFASLLSQPA
jgi:hypothetical protein